MSTRLLLRESGEIVVFFFSSFLPVLYLVVLFYEDLNTNWNRLTLSDREGPGCCLDEDCEEQEFIIATKFLTKRALNIEAIAKTFTPLWRSRNGFKVRNMGDHRMLFVFDNKTEVEKVLLSEPWSYDKHLVVMQSYDKISEELKFDRIDFLGLSSWSSHQIYEREGS